MKINLQNPPKYIKCLKSFYGFNEGEVFQLDEWNRNIEELGEKRYVLIEKIRSSSYFIHFDLLAAIEEGYFQEYELTPEELLKEEIKSAALQYYDDIKEKGKHLDGIIAFIDGAQWMHSRIKLKGFVDGGDSPKAALMASASWEGIG